MNASVAETQKPHSTTATHVLELDSPAKAPETPKPTLEAGEYKRHSLAAGYWGNISQSERPMRHVAAAEAEETFLRGMLDTPTERRERHPLDWFVSVAVHVVIVSVILIAPLAFTQAIDLHNFQLTYLTVPRPPAAAPPPPPSLMQAAKRAFRAFRTSALVAPIAIPQKIAMVKDEGAPEIEGVVGGIPGGEVGGVLGGILGGTGHGPAVPPPPPAASKKAVYRVGGDVKPPRELSTPAPDYPPIARVAHLEGVVIIDAVISENGDVVQARAVSGPGLLIPAALKAVMQWKYEPTYLDGTPVALQMEVQVHFRLH